MARFWNNFHQVAKKIYYRYLRQIELTVALIGVMVIVFNATFNNISVISWWSVLLVEETGEPGENHRPVASHWTNFIT